MSLLKKLGLVEDVNESKSEVTTSYVPGKLTLPKIQNEISTLEDLNLESSMTINEIYEKFNLTDMAKSIFKINELSIPLSSLATDARRKAILDIIKTMGLDIREMIDDADSRVNALDQTLKAFTQETIDIITHNDEQITELQSKIDELKQSTIERQKAQELQEKNIKDEIKRIEDIVNFIGPVE